MPRQAQSDAEHDAEQPDLEQRLFELEAELKQLRRALLRDAAAAPRLPQGDLPLLRCRVGGDDYGIPIGSVTEILRYVQVTRIADLPDAVVGVINVRGQVVAVIDARRRFGHAVSAPRRGTAIVLARSNGRAAGLIVDQVLDVVTAAQSALSAPSGPLARAQAIAAIASFEKHVVQVIDLGEVLSSAEWDDVADAIASVAPPASGTSNGGDVER